MKQFDLIIIGCGGIGSAVAYHASLNGLKVLCLEQYDLGHHQGGSHGETRAFRQAYYDNPQYLPLLREAYIQWKDLEKKAQKKLFVENGVLEIANLKNTDAKIGFLKKYHIPFELLTRVTINSRFPDFLIPDDMNGLFQPQAGFLYIDDCMDYFVNTALACGARIFNHEKVIAWGSEKDGKISVTTTRGCYQSKFLIITAGAWTQQLLPELHLHLEILQKKLVWNRVNSDKYTIEKGSPCFAYQLADDLFYGFPNIDGHIKIARHTGGSAYQLKGNTMLTDNNNEEEMAINQFIHTYLNVSTEKSYAKNCLYDNSFDKNFIVDIHPQHPQVGFATGLSGHAYKMSYVLATLLLDQVMGIPLKHDISFLSLKRFKSLDSVVRT